MKNKGCSNMLAIERRNAILAKLQDERKVVVSELATVFNVTEETIRRDLDKLEKEGMITRNSKKDDKREYFKAYMEALLLEAFGMKDDFRMNMNNILIRAEQDVIHSAEIAKMAKIKNDDAIHD